jgi:hypothetical protein
VPVGERRTVLKIFEGSHLGLRVVRACASRPSPSVHTLVRAPESFTHSIAGFHRRRGLKPTFQRRLLTRSWVPERFRGGIAPSAPDS